MVQGWVFTKLLCKKVLSIYNNKSSWPVAEKVVEPNQKKYPWYHRQYRRVPTIDQCYVDDVVCDFEANQQFKRDRLVTMNFWLDFWCPMRDQILHCPLVGLQKVFPCRCTNISFLLSGWLIVKFLPFWDSDSRTVCCMKDPTTSLSASLSWINTKMLKKPGLSNVSGIYARY